MSNPEQLRQQAKQLREAADKLDDAADVLDGFGVTNGRAARREPSPALRHAPPKVGRRGKRAAELAKFVQDKGPITRKEILAQVGLPEGTVGYLLKEKNGFHRDSEGRWSYKALAGGKE